MRKRYGLHLMVLASVLCVGYVAQGQNRDKTTDSSKKQVEPQTSPAKPKSSDAGAKAGDAAKNPTRAEKSDGSVPQPPDPDEEAIRSGAETFTKLYNDHNAKGLALLFTPKAEMIDENDKVVKGRDSIEAVFNRVFKENPQASMQIDVESVRVLTPSLAIEEGTTRSKDSPEDTESISVYVAIQAKIDGKWLLVCVRDWEAPAAELTPHDRLEQNLSWLIGEWIDESPDSNVHTVCTWDTSGNYLIQDFRVNMGGTIAMSGTMRIGWNAVTKQFQSWVFDSHGGHSTGSWIQDGDRWIIKMQGATVKGEVGSSTNYYRPINEETIAWGSFNRVLDGETLDDIPEVIVKRRPPQPTE